MRFGVPSARFGVPAARWGVPGSRVGAPARRHAARDLKRFVGALALLWVPLAPAPAARDRAAEAVATVDGVPVPARVYRMFVANAIDASGPVDPTQSERERVEAAVLDDLIDRTLVAAEARRRGLEIPHAALEARMAEWRSTFGGDANFRAHLRQHGLAVADWQQIVWQELAGAALAKALTADVRVSDAEIAAFHRRHSRNPRLRTLFVEAERVTAAHIFLDARPAVLAQRQRQAAAPADAVSGPVATGHGNGETTGRLTDPVGRQRQRAESLRRQALDGADFAALARAWSEDPGTRERGGDLGTFTRTTHAVAFDDAAFALRPGTISDVVRTEFGFHIIKVSSRTPERTRTLEECRTAIRDRLLAQARAERLAAWRDQRRRTATITRSLGSSNGHRGKGR